MVVTSLLEQLRSLELGGNVAEDTSEQQFSFLKAEGLKVCLL